MTSQTYTDAIEAHDAAQAKFNPVRDAYREGKVSDETFLAAAAEKKLADEAFDAAFAAEEAR